MSIDAILTLLPVRLDRLEAQQARILELLEQRQGGAADEIGGIRELAAWLGCRTVAAAKSAVHRDPALAGLAARIGTSRRWSRRSVEALLASRRAAPAQRLRVVVR